MHEADIVLFDKVLSGHASYNSSSNISDFKIGVPRHVFFDNLDPLVAQAIEKQLTNLSSKGAKLVEISLEPIWAHNEAFSFPVVFYEVMRDLPAYLADRTQTFGTLIAGIGSPDVAGAIGSQLVEDAMPEAAPTKRQWTIIAPKCAGFMVALLKITELTPSFFQPHRSPPAPIGHDETVDLNGTQVPTFTTYIRNTDLGSNIGAQEFHFPAQLILVFQ